MASRHDPVLSVSVAAQLAGMHAQTVRQYDNMGLVVASRTKGGGRRYSLKDVETLQEVQRLSQEEGINLAGIARILAMRTQIERLKRDNARLKNAVEVLTDEINQNRTRDRRVFAASQDGSIIALSRGERARERRSNTRSRTLVLWRER